MRSMDGSDGVEGFEVELPFSVVLPGSAGLSGSSPPQDVNNTDAIASIMIGLRYLYIIFVRVDPVPEQTLMKIKRRGTMFLSNSSEASPNA